MKHISDIANNLQGQKMFQVLAQAKELEKKGIDVIHLEIGDPDFDSPPNVVEAACQALKDGQESKLGLGRYPFELIVIKNFISIKTVRGSLTS